MHTIARYGQQLPAVYDGNLNGIFDFLGRQVAKLCRAAGSFISGKVKILTLGLLDTKFIENFFNGLADKAEKNSLAQANPNGKTMAVPDITDAEAAFITTFYETKLKVYVGALLDELKQASIITNPAAKIIALNTILNKINTVNDYYEIETESKNALSDNAREQRRYLIYEMLHTVNTGVQAAVAQMGNVSTVQVTFSPGIYNFSPLFGGQPIAQVTGENYKLGATTVATLPVINTPVKAGPLSANTATASINNATKVPTTVSANTTPVAKKSNMTPILIGAGVLVGGYLLLKGDNKKKAQPAKKAKTK